jgi:hypothetical protein
MGIYLTGGAMLYNKIMTNSEHIKVDNSIAVVEGNTVRIFGQVFPLKNPDYFPTGELESFEIKPTTIEHAGQTIPIGFRITLYRSQKFHHANIYRGYIYNHKGQSFKLSGAISFYPSGKLESFCLAESMETDFIVDGKKLALPRSAAVDFHEESGLPKAVHIYVNDTHYTREISESGKTIKETREQWSLYSD